ncbi:MAG: hypothetical protein BroJett042_20120 [Bacteroidota bacterium]|nr:MAG: hypothetical protein BroJett042_20120 [Bacteroidota bacterium]
MLIYPAKVLFAPHSAYIVLVFGIHPQIICKDMKRSYVALLLALIFLAACASPKPYYETKEGKRKQKYYNDIQYGRDAHPKMKF